MCVAEGARMRTMLFLGLAACLACGGTISTTGDAGGSEAGGSDASADAAKDGSSVDAGCAGDPPYCPWGNCLDGPTATCVDGQWSCPPPPPSCGGSSVACGSMICPPGQFCLVAGGGPPPPPDAGPTVGYSCQPVPSACLVYGQPTCGCIEMYAGCGTYGTVVQCTDPDGGVTLECGYP